MVGQVLGRGDSVQVVPEDHVAENADATFSLQELPGLGDDVGAAGRVKIGSQVTLVFVRKSGDSYSQMR